MADMVSLKGIGVGDSNVCCDPSTPDYSYGTRLYLNDDTVEALKAQGFQVGDTVSITALAVVMNKEDRIDEKEKEVDTSLGLQLTDMALSKAQTTSDVAKSLYPSMAD